MRRLVTWANIGRLLGLSFLGLGCCRLVDVLSGQRSGSIEQTRAGFAIVVFLSVVWFITLAVLLPLRVFMDRALVRRMQQSVAAGEIDLAAMGPVQRHLFYANYGSLPKWLVWPFVFVAIGMAVVLGLIFVGAGVAYVWFHVWKT
jgi:hypothetical protein